MSKTIDERVVSMQFDNSKFERNVSTTMSTLDKLKAKLNFRGASKGLEDINTAAKKIDLNPIGRAADTVGLKFSAMYTMADQVFRNITNSAMMYGKKIVDSLTIDPIKTGLSEYETKMNAVQVIKSNTRGKNDMNDIMDALDELNTYADKTIYNFAQMTSNVGKFTAQGYDVKAASKAVQGLANLAAASGASAEDMARATYQMSQAMGGTIRMMDWNSLRNANMATVDLKNTLMDLARVNGIAIDDMIKKHGTFEQTLQEGWLSGDMFTEAMNIYSGVYSEAELAAKGFTQSQIKNFMDLAKQAESAATEVKTFTQLWDVLKETAQSGWTQTWEIIFGDFETAKKMFTDLQNYFSNIINKMSDARNTHLGGAFNISNPWDSIVKKLESSGLAKISNFATKIGTASEELKNFQDIVNEVWRGDYQNAPVRFDLLEAAGYNSKVIQELVNKGYQYELTVEDVELAHKKFGITLDGNTEQSKQFLSIQKDITDQKLKDIGLTESEIKLYRDLEEESKRTGKSIFQLVNEMSALSGRTMIIESFKNAWSGLTTIFNAIKTAWTDMFPPMTVFQLYDIIKAVHNFSMKLRGNADFADKVTRTFRGLFAILRLVTNFVGGGIKIAFSILNKVLSYFNLNIWDATAYVGDLLVKFADWVDNTLDLTGVLNFLVPIIEKVVKFFKNLYKTIKESAAFQFVADKISKLTKSMKDWFEGLKEAENIPEYIFGGLIKGLESKATKVWNVIVEIAEGLITKFKEVFRIESPSKVMIAIGGFIMAGLLLGITDQYPAVVELLKTIGEKIIEFVKGLDLGTVIAGILSIGAIVAISKIASAVQALAAPFDGFSTMCEDIGKAVKGVGLSISAYFSAKAIKEVAIALAILAASVAALSFIPADKLDNAVTAMLKLAGALVILSLVMGGVLIVLKKTGDIKTIGLDILTLVGIAAAIFIVASAFKQLASINPDNINTALVGMLVVLGSMIGMLFLMKHMSKAFTAKDLWNVGVIVIATGGAMLLMSQAVKTMSELDSGAITKGLNAIALFGALITAVVFAARFSNKGISGVGTMLLKMTVALGLMVYVVKMAAGLDRAEVLRAVKSLALIETLFIAIILVSKLSGEHADKAGAMMFKMSAALLIMVGVVKLASKLSADEIKRGLGVMTLFGVFCTALVATSHLAGKNAAEAGKMLLSVSAALVLLVGVIFILSLMKEDALRRAVGCVALLEVCFALLIASVGQIKNSKYLKGTLISLIVALGLLSGVLIALTFIDSKKVMVASASISLMIGMFGLLLKMSSTLSAGAKTWWRNAATIVILGGVITGLAFIVRMLANKCNPESAIGSAEALAILVSSLAVSFSILSISKGMTKAKMETTSKMLYSMTAAIAMLGAVLVMMSGFDVTNAIPNATALAILLPVLAASFDILALSKSMTAAKMETTSKMLLAMSVCMAVLGATLVIMNGIDPVGAMANAVALSILLPVLSACFVILANSKSINPSTLGTTATALGALAVVAAMLGLVLAEMSALHVTNAIPNAIALSILLPVLTGCVLILTMAKGIDPASLGIAMLGLLALSGVMAALGLVLAMMTALKVADAIPNAIALSVLATTLTLLLIPLSIIGLIITGSGGTALLGVVGLLAMAVPLVAFVAILAWMQNIENASENTNLLITLMTVMTDCLIKISLVAPLTALAIPAILGLTGVIGLLGGFVVAIGALVKLFPDIKEFLSGGIDMLVQLAEGIGRMIGAFVAGIAIQLAATLPFLGAMLSAFMIAALPFVNLVKMVDMDVLKGVGILSASILALATVDLITGVMSFMGLGSTFVSLGRELSMFAILAMPFFTAISKLPDGALSGVKDLAEAMLIITGNDILSQLTKFITGGNSLADFGAQLGEFGPHMKTYADAVQGINPEAVRASAEAAKLLAEMASTLPNSGGWMGAIFGDNDMDDFGKGLKKLGQGLKSYGESVSGIESYKTSIDESCGIIKSLAEMSKTLPNSGGWMGAIFGENDIDVFGEKLVSFGGSLMGYGWAVKGIEEYNSSIDASINAAQSLSDMAATIPNSGVMWGMFGENDIDTFGTKLVSFGGSLMEYGYAIGGIAGVEDAIEASVSSAKSLVGLAEVTKEVSSGDWFKSELVKFGDNIVKFGGKLVEFGEKVAEGSFTNISKATLACTNIAKMAKETSGVDFGGLSKMTDTLSNMGTDCIDNFVKAFTNADAKVSGAISHMIAVATNAIKHFVHPFSIQATALIDGLCDGFDVGEPKVLTTVLDLTASATNELLLGYDGFYNAGAYLVSGFCAGISENDYKAEAKAKAMAEAAIEAAEEALDSHSPSRVFKKIGSYVPEGFALGIRMFGNVVRNASTGMTDEAVNTVKDSILRLSDIVESDIDTQPTIRPVLDLSAVRSGAGELGSILGGNRGLGVVANVGGISTMMNQNRQNGGNDDVVSAINKLRADLSNVSGDTYTFGDMTYDDGSNIANALSEVARAAKIERRR